MSDVSDEDIHARLTQEVERLLAHNARLDYLLRQALPYLRRRVWLVDRINAALPPTGERHE